MQLKLIQVLKSTLSYCIEKNIFPLDEIPLVEVNKSARKEHGDYASNIAMSLASRAGKKPREIAELIIQNLQDPEGMILKAEIAGPGFINFFLSLDAYQEALREILEKKENYGKINLGKGQKVLIEYVSANPTGPMHVGHGRNAVVGDVLARMLAACGYQVSKEFYVNDHGVQIQTLGKSALYYFQKHKIMQGKESKKKITSSPQANGEGEAPTALPVEGGTRAPVISIPPPPEGSYQGAYLEELVGKNLKRLEDCENDPIAAGKEMGKDLLEKIKEDLAKMQIAFDHFFSESSLYDSGQIEKALHNLKEAGYLFEQEGATWFRSTAFGDDKDRVLIKSDGSYTYFTPDIAYHRNKFERRFDLYLNIWGEDHAGYVPRIQAPMEALDYDPEKLKVITMQMVNLKRGNERVQMSKRSGTYITLREVVDEVGSDAARFFFMLRSANAQLDFDLELAQKQTADNPVFYIQYAHARISNILKKALEAGYSLDELEKADLSELKLPEELDLVHRLTEYPGMLEEAVKAYEGHKVGFYLLDLAKALQSYYSRAKSDGRYKVLSENKKASLSKLALIKAIQIVFQSALKILGISAPEYMKQDEE